MFQNTDTYVCGGQIYAPNFFSKPIFSISHILSQMTVFLAPKTRVYVGTMNTC